ncbi:MAG: glycoside hydrolase family 10 protein [Elainellaceae cyanobacterium]
MVDVRLISNSAKFAGRLSQRVLLSAFGLWVTAGGVLGLPDPSHGPTAGAAVPGALAQSSAAAPQSRRSVLVLHSPLGSPLSESRLAERFEAAGVSYQLVRWTGLERRLADPAGGEAPILFVPSAEMISRSQVALLRDFLDQGGQLVVSGRIGLASPDTIQQELRSLLGAYWAFPLLQPAYISPEAENAAPEEYVAMGGVVVPHGPGSQVLATWSDTAGSPYNSPAVVKTDQVLFLGWNWGEESDSQMDSAWLQAAVLQFDQSFAVGGPINSAAADPASNDSAASGGEAQAVPEAVEPIVSAQATGTAVSRNAPPQTSEALPIWPREANLMTEELESLMGRFESALLLAESTVPTVNAQAVDGSILVASTEQVQIADSDRDPVAIADQKYAILERVQGTLDEFPTLVAQREYGAARQAWFEARRLLWDNFPTDHPVAQPEIRAIWLDRGTIVAAESHEGLERVFDQLARTGINTVFFETLNAGYPIYPSSVAPEQNPLISEDWDPLKSAVELAHDRDIELHAWVWVFATGNQRHNTLVGESWDYPGPVLERRPDWANADHRGNPTPQGQTKPFLDPANSGARRYLLRLFSEILTEYEVDGLQLDYIRYPFQDPSAGRSYGYGTASRRAFRAQTGVDPATISPSDRALWQQWTDFRIEQVDSFVSAVSRLIDRRRPEAILSAAVFPMPEHERRHKIQQGWERWAREGEVDIIATMSYAIDTPQLEALVNPWLDSSLSPALVLPAIRLLNLPNTLALDQIQALRDLPAGGYALFAAENLNQNEPLQQVFQRTQGSIDAPIIPYRQPFAAAATRFEVLQREWDVALGSGRLYISAEQQEALMEQAIALRSDLDELAEDPSSKNLRQAKRELRQFRREFDQWMALQAINGRYRVQTWENRLAAIDSLLAYGEERL